MGTSAIFRAVTVHDQRGRVFANKLEQPQAFGMLSDLSLGPASYNMRTLATAIRMMVENPSCKRLLVPVDMRTIEEAGMEYAQLLMTIPKELRSRIFVELQTKGKPISNPCAAFAQAIQEECGMSIVAWARCNHLEYVESVVEALSPAVLAIDGKCLKLAMSAGDRAFFIDAVEAAVQGGARVLAAGVETAEERDSMLEIGVELLCGGLVSTTCDVEEGAYEAQGSIMKAYERRKGRGQDVLA